MFAQGRNNSNVDKVFAIPEIDILNFYLGINEIPCLINSPLRVDNNPSFGINTTNGIKLHFKDFSTQESGGTFDLLMKYFQIPFDDLLEKIYNDMSPGYTQNGSFVIPHRTKGKVSYNNNTELKCKTREWRDYDLKFWEEFGISLPWLQFGNVYPISHTIIHNLDTNQRYTFAAEKYAYVYVEFKDEIESLKIYQPFSQTRKWTNKHDSSVWDLWQQLPETGETLIITSSRKDALCIWENTGLPACSLQAETALPKIQVVEELKNRFNNVYILYDNDFDKKENWGENLGAKMSEKYGLTQLHLPIGLKAKDPSDLCKMYGRKTINQVIKQIVDNHG